MGWKIFSKIRIWQAYARRINALAFVRRGSRRFRAAGINT